MAGKAKRFIVLIDGGDYFRSGNSGLSKGNSFPTREAAQEAINKFGSADVSYRIRQK